MKKIALAIIAVMKTVKGMEKNSRVGAGTRAAYDGTKDKDVKEVMNKAMVDNGLCILPIDVQAKTTVSRWEEIDQYSKFTPKAIKSKQSIFTEVTTKYLLLHESGESIELAGYGQGVDTQDKGAGKATTYALKNCLLYMFLTPVGKIDDTDNTHSQDHATPQKKQAAPKKKVYPVANYDKAAKSLHEGKCTINEIKAKFMLSNAAEKVIKEKVLNLADIEFQQQNSPLTKDDLNGEPHP